MATSVGSASIVLSIDSQGVSRGLSGATAAVNDWRSKWIGISDNLPPLKPPVVPDLATVPAQAERARGIVASIFLKPIDINLSPRALRHQLGGLLGGAGALLVHGMVIEGLANLGTAIVDSIRGSKQGISVGIAEAIKSVPFAGGVIESVAKLEASLLGINKRTADLLDLKEKMSKEDAKAEAHLRAELALRDRQVKEMQEEHDLAEKDASRAQSRQDLTDELSRRQLAGKGDLASRQEAERQELASKFAKERADIDRKQRDAAFQYAKDQKDDTKDLALLKERYDHELGQLDLDRFDASRRYIQDLRELTAKQDKEKADAAANVADVENRAQVNRLRTAGDSIAAENKLRNDAFEERKRQAREAHDTDLLKAIGNEQKSANDLATKEQATKRQDELLKADRKIEELRLRSVGRVKEAEIQAIKDRYAAEIKAADDAHKYELSKKLAEERDLEIKAASRTPLLFSAGSGQVSDLNQIVRFDEQSKSARPAPTGPSKLEDLNARMARYLEGILGTLRTGVPARAS